MIVNLTGYVPEARFDDLPWTHARIEEAAAATGPWTAIDTIALNPLDSDPSMPATRNFTTTAATLTAGWYRVVWVDAALLESATAPVQNVLPFASVDELARRLGLVLTTDEETRANTLLSLASGMIRKETQQTISLVENDTLTMPSLYGERIRLPQRPVVSIASVSIDDVDIPESGAWYLDGDELVRANWRLLLQRHFAAYNGVGWLGPLRIISIVYTHGYPAVPEVVKAVCMEMVVRCFVNPGAVARESVGNTSTVYDNNRFSPTGLLMTDAEKQAVNDAVRRTSGSVTLR